MVAAWVAKEKTLRRGGLTEHKMYPDEFVLGWGSDLCSQSSRPSLEAEPSAS
jgi:hypothetical protein